MYIKSLFSSIIFKSIELTQNECNIPNEVIYVIIIISLIIFFLNIIGIIKLCQIDHKIKFEEWVLISGIIELSLINIYLEYKRYSILLTLGQTLQIIIILFITRRFFKSYFLLSNSPIGSFCYNSYYVILVIVNILFTIASITFDLFTIYNSNFFSNFEYINDICSFIYDFFGLITSSILLIIGIKLKRIMIKMKQFEQENKKVDKFSFEEYNISQLNNSEKKNNNLNNENTINKETGVSDTETFTVVSLNIEDEDIYSQTYYLLKETSKDINMTPEIFLNIRIKQLNIYIWVTLITNIISCSISFLLIYISKDFKREDNGEIFPTNKISYYIILIENINVMIITFMNWFTLYFVVRNTFPIKNHLQKNNNEDSGNDNSKMFNLNELNKTNKSINDFLNID